jgi:hypothetical protein
MWQGDIMLTLLLVNAVTQNAQGEYSKAGALMQIAKSGTA